MVDYEGMLAETVRFRGHDGGEVSGYLARQLGAGPYPGVIVIHEVFGLVTHIKEIARKFAAEGYVAVAPDLHHREGPGNTEDVASAVRAAGGNPDARTVGDVRGAVELLRSLPYCNGRVGVIGYCSGGRQAYLVACSVPGLDAAIVCYGGRIVAGPSELSPRQPVSPIDMPDRGPALPDSRPVRRGGHQFVARAGAADRAGAKALWQNLRNSLLSGRGPRILRRLPPQLPPARRRRRLGSGL